MEQPFAMMKPFTGSPLICPVLREPYALPAPLGMAGGFELLLDGNGKRRPGETELVAVGVN